MFYTYIHVRKDNNQVFYIGKGVNKRAWRTVNRNPHWKNIVKKCGFRVEILKHWHTEQEALEHEIELIEQYRKLGNVLANMTSGGEGTSGYKHTEDWKRQMSERFSGNKNPRFAKSPSEYTRRKISESNRANNLRGKNCVNFKGIIVAKNLQTGEETEFSGVAELNAAGFQNTNVYKCVNGQRKSHKGHTFKRLEK